MLSAKNFRITYLLVFLLLTVNAIAQTGKIEGTITDKITKETLVGANVVIVGTNLGAIADFDGHYSISNIKPGTYNVQISFISYNPVLFESVKIEPNKTTIINTDLEEVSVTLQNVEVVAVRRGGSEISMISSIKANQLVASGISSQQIQRSQDRDASEVVKRVPGITIIDDRFIVVRGLNQRYNNVWLNNAATPSSETDVKAFSFDVIPSSLIENIMIYKSSAPELPAEVAGGFIKIFTKNMPDSNFISIDYSASYQAGTTFEDFKKYKGGKYDWLGFDDGSRALPSGFPANLSLETNPDVINNYAKSFNKNWTYKTVQARPDQRGSITFGQRFKIGKVTIGTSTALNYSNSFDNTRYENNSYLIYNTKTDEPNYRFKFIDDQFTNNVKTSVLHNWAFFLGKGNKIEIKNLFNQIGFTRTTLRDGREYYGGIDVRSNELRFLSRSTYSGQIGGDHTIKQGNTKLNWNLGYAFANRLEPDRKMLTSKLNTNTNQYELGLLFTANPKQAGRLYLDNFENIYSSGFNAEQKLKLAGIIPTIKTGFYFEYKNREFNARNIGYAYGQNFDPTSDNLLSLPFDQIFVDENFDYTNKIKLAESTNNADSYTSDNTLLAGYLGLNIPFTPKLNLYGGVRLEQNRMTLSSFEAGGDPINVDNSKLNFFPSANISYNLNEKNLFRVAYGRSINRPEFREIAPFVFYDFNDFAGYSGNPNLKDGDIHNLDIRFENYPSSTETFSLAFFYKEFKNPIEMVYNETGSGLEYTFENAHSAYTTGIELEIRKSLENIDILKNINLIANAAWIKSRVQFPEGSVELSRPLQGQSPYIANAGVYYNNPRIRLMISAIYNIIGERILIVGQPQKNPDENIPDIYETSRNLIDLTISKKIGNYLEIKGGIKDLLNEPVLLQQSFKYNNTEGKQVVRNEVNKKYSPGTVLTLGLSVKF